MAVKPIRFPGYQDSTPLLSVGDSSFEDWYSRYVAGPKDEPIKQAFRNAYAAGMGDPLVTYARPQVDMSNIELDSTLIAKIGQMTQADLLDFVMHETEYLTDSYYCIFRTAIWKRYEELRGTT